MTGFQHVEGRSALRSRFLSELNYDDLMGYLARGGKTALLPVGSVEMHGPHQPLGTDSLVANAFALKIAEAGDGIVLPEIHYTWAGSTDGFAGTISVEPSLVQQTVEAVALRATQMGFRRLLVLSIHRGNEFPLYLFARQIYEKYLIPAVYIDAFQPLTDEARALFAGEWDKGMEASVVLAAMQILGLGQLYTEAEMAYEDEPPPVSEALRNIGKIGVVGRCMQDPRHHACPSALTSLERGLQFFEKQVQAILPILPEIDRYIEDTAAQANKGWWYLGDPRNAA